LTQGMPSARFAPQVGAVLSADIAVPEHEREIRFYSRVLRTGDNASWASASFASANFPSACAGGAG
jgi:hypothetical protein